MSDKGYWRLVPPDPGWKSLDSDLIDLSEFLHGNRLRQPARVLTNGDAAHRFLIWYARRHQSETAHDLAAAIVEYGSVEFKIDE